MKRGSLRQVGVPMRVAFIIGAIGVAAEAALLLDFDGARADDLDLLAVGGSGSGPTPPPNILFLFDTSRTMNNLPCTDLDGSQKCDSSQLTSKAVGATSICQSPAMQAVVGTDLTGDGVQDAYDSPYSSDGGTLQTNNYPVLVDSDTFAQDGVYSHTSNSPTWTLVSDTGTLSNAIEAACNMSDCYKKSRCIYSLRTLGYFWEPTGSTCGTGDPMAMCAVAGCGNGACDTGETACTCPADCVSTMCGDGCCYGAETAASCPADCSGVPSGALGSTCTTDTQCTSGRCKNGVCSTCKNNGQCSPGSCVDTNCEYSFCGSYETCTLPLTPVCGDTVCSGSENRCTCPGDCGAGACGDGVCCATTGENAGTCLSDCPAVGCGDGLCAPGETPCSCQIDCGADTCGNGICCANTNETKCSCSADCGASTCGDGICCATSGETTANCITDCPPATRTLGATCTNNSDCNSGRCKSGRCSTCLNNGNCPGGSNACINTSCIHSYCSTTGSCNPGGGGGGGGGPVTGFLDLAVDLMAEAEVAASMPELACIMAEGVLAPPPAATPTNVDGPLYLGDYLNFYPPKGISLKAAFLDAVNNMSGDARLGLFELDGTGHDIKPPCSQVFNDTDDCFDGDSATLCGNNNVSELENDLDRIDFVLSTKPLATALDSAGESFTASNGVSTPICDYSSYSPCSTNNFIVLVTDGLPDGDATDETGIPFVAAKMTESIEDDDAVDNGSLLDEVARALAEIDHRTDIDEAQTLGTYTVSYGRTDPADSSKCIGLLDSTATMGSGRCLPATNAEDLKTVLLEVINEIILRTQSFTAPSVPTTRFSGTSSLTNAAFRPAVEFPLWEGHVYAFDICDEKLARETGTSCSCDTSTMSDDEVCIRSADTVPEEVAYDADGYLTVTPRWDAALCLAGDIENNYDAKGPDQAKPDGLDVEACYRSADERAIYTAYYTLGDSTTEYDGDDQIAFTTANATAGSALTTALDVGGDTAKAEKLIEFFRGKDRYDADADGDVNEDRNISNIRDGDGNLMPGWWKLGDIFHSIPNVIERPTGRGVGAWAITDSYKAFVEANENRDKVLLVGANDGMLHAFNAGTWNSSTEAYSYGTGEELWAFVSPEMLPKLKNVCGLESGGCEVGEHNFMVDGSVMVRDIWMGGAADKMSESNASKWRTVAVYGHRDGGSTYVGIDVTDANAPQFLWQFPQRGSAEESEMGRSWLDTHPSPASIGPVRWDHDDDATTAPIDKWVVLLSGGFDQLEQRGNNLYMLDAYTGAVVWKASQVVGTATEYMDYSFPATPVFYPDLSGAYPYIAGIVAADRGGQLWHIPTPAAAMSSGKFPYTPSLFFQTLSGADRVVADNDTSFEPGEYQRRPFFFAPTLTRNQGKVRVIIGSGDRDMLVPDPDVDNTIEGYVCDDQQRLYAIDIDVCTSGTGSRPCNEGDLQEIDPANGVYAAPTSRGWYYKLPAGEKSATPYDVFGGYALYSVFAPTVACGGSGATCSPDAKGVSYLYGLQYLTGYPVNWDGDTATTETRVSLGEGVPTAPSVSVAVSASGATPTLFAGASNSGLVSQRLNSASSDLAVEILRFYVSREVHDLMHVDP